MIFIFEKLNYFDHIFAAASTGVSAFLCYKYITNPSPKKAIPIHFNWWGNADNSVENTKAGAAVYPVIVAAITIGNIYSNYKKAQKMRNRTPAEIQDEADKEVEEHKSSLAFLKTKVMPLFDRNFIVRSSALLVLCLQEQAHQISLGVKEKVSTLLVRSSVGVYAGIIAAHMALGTERTMK